MTDGVLCLTDTYGSESWSMLLDRLERDGPSGATDPRTQLAGIVNMRYWPTRPGAAGHSPGRIRF